jgi:60 kDa SS-A/Ro ribonucleoprotein
MAKSTYATALATKKTPQTQAIPGREKDMAKNNAGGVTFTITPFQMLERFLILGSDQPTYYASAQKLTKDNAANVRACLAEDVKEIGVSDAWKRTVDKIVEISVSGRAPKNAPALFALAVASTPAFSSPEIAQYATSQLSKVARTGTHLMHYADYVNGMRGWGRNLKNAFGNWLTGKNESQLAYQLAKYQNRDGWSTKDLLALAHAKTADARKSALLAWARVGGVDALKIAAESWTRTSKKGSKYNLTAEDIATRRGRFQSAYDLLTGDSANRLISAMEAAKKATTVSEITKLIREGGLTHEMIPTNFKTDPEVWDALLEKMPLTAMVRNLGVMSKVGLLKPLSEASKIVVNRLHDQQYIQKSRVHPLQVMLAQGTYRQGHGFRGTSAWSPVPTVIDALEDAFYLAFANCVPTGKNIYIGIDVSGSMSWPSSMIQGTDITSAQAAAAMALVVARKEPNYAIYAFSTRMQEIGITAKDTIQSAMAKTSRMSAGGTDCALPILHAGQAGYEVDSFLTITDNETWAGAIQPIQALKNYRKARGKQDVSLIAMGMTATQYSIADPADAYNLNVVGFDANVPLLVTDFIRGNSAGVEVEEVEE